MPRSMIPIVRKNLLTGALLVYVSSCLAFGGASRQALFSHGALQSAAAVGIAAIVVSWPRSLSARGIIVPIALIVVLVVVAGLQSIPLPPEVWTSFAGREEIAKGFDSLEIPLAPLPVSLDPEATQQGFPYFLPTVFILLLSLRIGLQRLYDCIPWLLCVLGCVSVLLGLAQVLSRDGSSLYIYANSNFGHPVGTFANANHFGSSLLIMLPFCILALQGTRFSLRSADKNFALGAFLITALSLLVLGVVTAGSLAVYIIFPPVIGLAFFGSLNGGNRNGSGLMVGMLLAVIVAVGVVVASTSPLLTDLGVTANAEDSTSRQRVWSYVTSAIQDYWPIGSGMGTYESVIPLFEDPNNVTSRYTAFAYNEYLQILMEFGVAGLIALTIAFFWLCSRFVAIWVNHDRSSLQKFRRMASIGVLVCMLHSAVDYPCRTPSIVALLSICIAIIALPINRDSRTESAPTENSQKRVIL